MYFFKCYLKILLMEILYLHNLTKQIADIRILTVSVKFSGVRF
jgi:hypothetical protein